MTIPASNFDTVTPSVLSAGGTALDLNGLLLTENTRVPIGSVASFASATAVETYFGATSDEAISAGVYFGGFNNSNIKPGALLIAQYPAVAVGAYARGGSVAALTLTQLQAISGALAVTIDGTAHSGTVNLSGVTSFSNAAQVIETALGISGAPAASVTGSISGTTLTVTAVASGTIAVGQKLGGVGVTANTFVTGLGTGTGGIGTYTVSQSQTVASETLTTTQPAVSYDSVSGGFVVASGTVGATSTIAYATGAAATSLKLTLATGAVLSQGAAATTPVAFMNSVTLLTQNWANLFTNFDPDGGTGITNKLAFAQWTSSQNSRYGYIAGDTDASPTTTNPATASLGQQIKALRYSGTFLIWEPVYQHGAAFVAGAAASIDFAQTNGRITFKFKYQSGLPVGVTDETVATNLAANGYNFIGAYATANDGFNFLANGVVSGPFTWFDSYVNQIWLNNQLQLDLVTLLTTVKSIPYTDAGNAKIETALADTIKQGLDFGAYRSGVTLSASQKSQVNSAAGGRDIASVLQTQGWYLLIGTASPTVRQARGTPPMTFFYVDGEAVQTINLASIMLQ